MPRFNYKLAKNYGLNQEEIALFESLSNPILVQDYLVKIPFNLEKKIETLFSPVKVIEKSSAHCLEGALFSLIALSLNGFQAYLLDMKARDPDYDHVVTLFKQNGFYGAISKTNHAVLRFRDPIYRNPRELVMSYFHEYFLDSGEKTLQSFSKPLSLKNLTSKLPRDMKSSWVRSENDLWLISDILDEWPHQSFFPKGKKVALRTADKVEIEAGKIVEWK